jgi:riboflavin kinase/FMN adenylyltransferase
MEVIKYDDSFDLDIKKSIVSIGNYDGVHIGHQHILKELTSKSRQSSSKSIVVTFEPHPKKFFMGNDNLFLLSGFDEKVSLIRRFSVDCLVYFVFDESFASMSADDFVNNILIDKLKVEEVIVGYNFNFGKDRLGNTEFLKSMGTAHGFKVTVVEAKKVGGDIVSSSYIRELISLGNVTKAAQFLGRSYSLTGKVVKGKDIGKKLGFPTVNLSVKDKLIPKDGVYSVIVRVMGKKLGGVANIGYQPTFGKNKHSIEAHIIDFDEELYDREVTIEFVDKLRDEKKFQGEEELREQIRNDVKAARASLLGK